MLAYFAADLISLMSAAGHAKSGRVATGLTVPPIVPICTIGGLYSITMGADPSNYPVTSSYYSMNHGMVDSVLGQQTEWLFSVLAWVLTRIFKDVHRILLLMQVITLLPVTLVLSKETLSHYIE